MKKRYILTSGMDTSITLEIDTTKMTAEYAAEVNGFWSGAADVLDASDDDVFQAVARRAAARLLGYLMDGYNEGGAVENLSEQEGWPDKDSIGIKIIDHEIPDLDATLFDVEELAV